MLTGKYSIRDLERLTGIKAHTIRIWEARYMILKPDRTDTKIRVYDDSELKKILKISYLNKEGYKISKLAELSDEQLSVLIAKAQIETSSFSSQIDTLVHSMLQLDEQMAYSAINKSIENDGFEVCFEEVILPVLHKTGILWQANSIEPAREHFLAGIIENILQYQIATVTKPSRNGYKVILMQMSGDVHEMSLLYIKYLFAKYQIPLLYLGVSVPPEDIRSIVANRNDLFIYVHSVMNHNELFSQNLIKLIGIADENRVLLSGKALEDVKHSSVIPVKSIVHLKQLFQDNYFQI